MISLGMGRNGDLVKYKKSHGAEIKRLHRKLSADQRENKEKDRDKPYEQEKPSAEKADWNHGKNRNRSNRKGSREKIER